MEKVTVEANSPLTVAVGEAFRVEFALNAKPDGDTFKAPSFEGFDVLAGPAISQGSSVQIVNGSMTKSVSYTYTFVLLPQAAGNVTIGAAEVKVDGSSYRTRPLPIEIVNEGKSPGAGGTQSRPREDSSPDVTAQNQIAKDDILLRAVVSRTSVYKGEPLRVTFKLYERVPVVGYNDVKFPSFNGFWAQELNTDNARRQRETFNGKVYETLVTKEYLLYPQQAGTLVIEPAELTAVAQVVVPGRRNVDPFFGGGPDFVNVPRKVQSPRINIAVKPLPAGAPASFSGAVGSFTMDAVLPQERLADCKGEVDALLAHYGVGRATFLSIEPQNWNALWESNFTPVEVDGRLTIRAPFHAPAATEAEVVIMPKMSFGTGHHATTCLMASGLLDRDVTGLRGLDMGSGTGVLAIVAALRGAEAVDAVDIDDWADANCRENIASNGVADRIEPMLGDVRRIAGRHYGFILANINRNILLADMSAYAAALDAGGWLLMSGILEADVAPLSEAARAAGFSVTGHALRNGWARVDAVKN